MIIIEEERQRQEMEKDEQDVNELKQYEVELLNDIQEELPENIQYELEIQVYILLLTKISVALERNEIKNILNMEQKIHLYLHKILFMLKDENMVGTNNNPRLQLWKLTLQKIQKCHCMGLICWTVKQQTYFPLIIEKIDDIVLHMNAS